MSPWMTRADAEAFAKKFKPFDIVLDDPEWHLGFGQLKALWEAAGDGKIAPSRRDIDLTEVPNLLPMIQIYELVGQAADVNIRVVYQGTDLATLTREETGPMTYTDDYKGKKTQKLFLAYLEFLLRWPLPFWGDGEMFRWRGRPFGREKFISLPLSSNGTAIDGVITASSFYRAC